jgi:hypothetical protein
MKPETLERLVIDRTLGELAPDTEELLVAYLDANADAARSVEDIRGVIETANRAARIGSAEEEEGPPLPSPRFVAVASRGRRRPRAAWAKRVAAAAVIGLAFWLGSLGTRPDADLHSVPMANSGLTLAPRTSHTTNAGFWSLGELSRRNATRRESRLPAINWPGPVSRPRLGERS